MVKVDFNEKPTLLGEGMVFRTPSESRAGLFHFTFKLRYGGFVCTCESWQYRGSCKHVLVAQTDSPEAQEIQKRWRQEQQNRLTPRAGGPDPHDMH